MPKTSFKSILMCFNKLQIAHAKLSYDLKFKKLAIKRFADLEISFKWLKSRVFTLCHVNDIMQRANENYTELQIWFLLKGNWVSYLEKMSYNKQRP